MLSIPFRIPAKLTNAINLSLLKTFNSFPDSRKRAKLRLKAIERIDFQFLSGFQLPSSGRDTVADGSCLSIPFRIPGKTGEPRSLVDLNYPSIPFRIPVS